MKRNRLAPLVLAVMVVCGALAYPLLPAQVPSHWNVAGEIDGTMPRFWGVALFPLIALGVWLLMLLLPRFDPRGRNYAAFAGTYRLFMNVLLVFLGALYLVTLAAGLGWPLPVSRLVAGGVGLLFAVMGNELGRVAPNYFVGVRTPWTLADPEVWRLTHRATGRAMVVAGLAMLLAAVLLPDVALFMVVVGASLGFVVFAFAVSYMYWRRVQAGRS